jgi:hypothetical protein
MRDYVFVEAESMYDMWLGHLGSMRPREREKAEMARVVKNYCRQLPTTPTSSLSVCRHLVSPILCDIQLLH